MAKRATIKDIAEKAGVSLRSVHCALNGKPGVSEKTRQRILDIARECEYRPNMLASSLKRKAIKIGAALPGATEENRFYFSQVWEGVREYVDSIRDFNIELVEEPFTSELDNHAFGLTDLLDNHEVDGLLTVGSMDASGRAALNAFFEKKIPVVLIGGDLPQSGRLCCVMPDYEVVGRVMAELLTRQIRGEGGTLLCTGNENIPSHLLVAAGFDAYMKEHAPSLTIRKIPSGEDGGVLYDRIIHELEDRTAIAGCASVYARGSVQLGRALSALNMGGTIPAIASDLFTENAQYLRDNIFTAIIHKHPYSQSYLAAKVLLEHLLGEPTPVKEILHVGAEIILQSNLPLASPTRLSF